MQHLLTLRFIWLNSFFGKGISAWFISETRTNVPSDGTFSFRENHASFLLRSFTSLLNNRQLPPSQVKTVDYSEMPSRTDKVMQEWDCAHSSGYVHWIVKIYACHVCTWQMCRSPHCLQLVAFFLSSGCDWGSQALASRSSFVIALSRGSDWAVQSAFVAAGAMWWSREPTGSTLAWNSCAFSQLDIVGVCRLMLIEFESRIVALTFSGCEIVNLYVHTRIKRPPFFFAAKLMSLHPQILRNRTVLNVFYKLHMPLVKYVSTSSHRIPWKRLIRLNKYRQILWHPIQVTSV